MKLTIADKWYNNQALINLKISDEYDVFRLILNFDIEIIEINSMTYVLDNFVKLKNDNQILN